MAASDGYCMMLCTCPDDDHAEGIARALIGNRLAACVQMLPIRSIYTWKGELCRDEERLLLIKTRSALYALVEDCILKNHPYEVPEIVKIPIETGLERYLAWIDDVTLTPGTG